MTHVKICGIKTSEALQAAVAAGASMIGFVHFPKSPRHIEPEETATLRALLPAQVKAVSLIVDADDALIDRVIKHVAPDFLQLHGKETVQRIAEIRKKNPVIKAVGIHNQNDVAHALTLANVADIILFDAKAPEGATRPGGNAVSFDWELLARLKLAAPWMLSGGLTPENVAEAIRVTHAPYVDVSSGVESSPGVKDERKIRNFIQAAMV